MRAGLVGLVFAVAATAGADEAVYRMIGPVVPAPRAANGYVLDVLEEADGSVVVHVETSLLPVGSKGTYAAVLAAGGPEVPEGFELPGKLRSELRPEMDAWDAATAVLAWVSAELDLVDRDRRPQDAISVLARRGGRCSGLANATAALLLAAGFEARTVSGVLVTGRGVIPHRWVECLLPGAGWVPTDPTLGWWAVTPRHVAFGNAVDDAPEITVLRPAADELKRLPRIGTTVVRPNRGVELVCRLEGGDARRPVTAWLERGSDRRHAVLGPEVRFGGLLPGRWLLVVELDGRVVERRRLDLSAGAAHSYVVRLPAPTGRTEVGS